MTPQEYSQEARRTASRECNWLPGDMIHSAMGIASEAGEILDNIKALDCDNLKEELGDLCWFMDMLMRALGTGWADVMQGNIAKLRVRYPGKFNLHDAVARDKVSEMRAVLGETSK